MNTPNRFELYTLGDAEKLYVDYRFFNVKTLLLLVIERLEIQEDTKIPNAATFKVNKQDHTMAGMIRS